MRVLDNMYNTLQPALDLPVYAKQPDWLMFLT